MVSGSPLLVALSLGIERDAVRISILVANYCVQRSTDLVRTFRFWRL